MYINISSAALSILQYIITIVLNRFLSYWKVQATLKSALSMSFCIDIMEIIFHLNICHNKRTKVPEAHQFFFHFSPFQIKTQLSFWWPFWMSEINFWLHFLPFQIKTQLRFFSKWPPFWMSEIHFHLHFSPFHIQLKLSFLAFLMPTCPSSIRWRQLFLKSAKLW
jgi:hypothetical protein